MLICCQITSFSDAGLLSHFLLLTPVIPSENRSPIRVPGIPSMLGGMNWVGEPCYRLPVPVHISCIESKNFNFHIQVAPCTSPSWLSNPWYRL